MVDNDPGVRGSLDSLVRSAGMVGLKFKRAEDLLAAEKLAEVSCIVTDVHMPGMSGLQLQDEMNRRGYTRPTIFMTAYPTQVARDQALAGGAVAFLKKPLSPDGLLSLILDSISERGTDGSSPSQPILRP
nr:response regulator [Sphingomonas sp. PAMC26645]